MSSINGFYIDDVYVAATGDNNNTLFNGNNVLNSITNSSELPAGTSQTTGLKWVVQVTNGSGSAYNPSDSGNAIKLTVCTNTYNSSEDQTYSYDLHYTCNQDIDIADNGSIYFGWDLPILNDRNITGINEDDLSIATVTYSSSSNISNPTTQEVLLADQSVSNSIIVGTRFRLYINGVEKDRVGIKYDEDNGWVDGEGVAAVPIPYVISGTNHTYLTGLLSRKPDNTSQSSGPKLTQDAPSLIYKAADWNTKTTLTSIGSQLRGTAAGDPHITTLAGEHYKFVHIGAFRLFEQVVDGKLLIINGCSENGPARWSHNEYIKKFYIQYGEQSILLDNGFRGQEVTVLENNGIEYKEQKLQFHETAKRYSGGLNGIKPYTTTDANAPETDDLPGYRRNEVAFQIKNDEDKVIMDIKIQNVNEYNLQPCRLGIQLCETTLSENAKGCIVSKKFVPVCKFDDIKSMKPLPELEEKHMELIPEDEIEPCQLNTQWR